MSPDIQLRRYAHTYADVEVNSTMQKEDGVFGHSSYSNYVLLAGLVVFGPMLIVGAFGYVLGAREGTLVLVALGTAGTWGFWRAFARKNENEIKALRRELSEHEISMRKLNRLQQPTVEREESEINPQPNGKQGE